MVRSLLSTRHDCQAFGEHLAFGSRTPKPIFVLAGFGGGSAALLGAGRSSGRVFFAGIENRRGHDRTVLGEGVGAILDVVPALQGRKLRP